MIPLSVPVLEGNEWEYIKECLDTGWVSSAGSFVDRFENEIAAYTGSRHAVACVNGTAALQLSLELVGVERGDEVIVPTVTFIAPVNAVRYNGAHPVFMDSGAFYTIDPVKTARFIREETILKNGVSYNRISSRRIAAIVLVHVFGNAVDLDGLVGLCQERNIAVVEDAAESLGTRYSEGRYAGCHTGTIGKAGCFSFNGNKIITSGGGGIIVTDDEDLARRARYLTQQAKDDTLYFVHHSVGYNYRLTNIQAALGVAQLELLDLYLDRKRKTYLKYKELISDIPGLRISDVPANSNSNHWMILLVIDPSQFGLDRDDLILHLDRNGIQTRPVWQLNHLQTPYLTCQHYKIECAYDALAHSVNLPSSTNITNDQIEFVVETIRNG